MTTDDIQFEPATGDDLAELKSFLEPFMDDRLLLKRTSLELELLLRHGFKAVSQGAVVGFCALEIYSKKFRDTR